MILTVTLNPSVDRAIYLDTLKLHDTNRVVKTATDAGGKGINLSRVADELGGNTMAIGLLGGGPGAFVRSVLDRERVPHDFVEIAGETRVNFSVEDESDAPPTTFNERGPTILASEWDALLAKCRAYAPTTGWACLGGSIPPGLDPDAYRTLGRIFKGAGCSLMIDADGEPMKLGLDARPDLIKPNSKEASRLLDRPVESDNEAVTAARDLHAMGIPTVLLSRGADGAIMANAEGVWFGSSPTVDAHSTIGSGDSLLGAFLWAIRSGFSPEAALQWGMAAGAATALTDGSEIARQAVIERLLPMAKVERV